MTNAIIRSNYYAAVLTLHGHSGVNHYLYKKVNTYLPRVNGNNLGSK